MRSAPQHLPAISAAVLSSAGATKPLHALSIVSGAAVPIATHNALISAYAASHDLRAAREVFDRMPQRSPASFNSLIAAYAQRARPGDACALLGRMLAQGLRPTCFTFSPILSSLPLGLHGGIQLQSLILKTGLLHAEPFSATALIGFLVRNGKVDEAFKLFGDMPERTLVTWNSLISGFSQHGFVEESVCLFRELLRSGFRPSEYSFLGVLSAFGMLECSEFAVQLHGLMMKTSMGSYTEVGNACLHAYANCFGVDAAERFFCQMASTDVVTWNTMIAAFAKKGQPETALVLFFEMLLEGLWPNESTFASVISACANLDVPESGELMHAKAIKCNFAIRVNVSSSLISFYANCRCLQDAYKIFDDVPAKTVVSWNALISACSGRNSDALLGILKEMLLSGFQPNEFTFSLMLRKASGLDVQQLYSLVVKLGYENNDYVASAVIVSSGTHGICFDALPFNKSPTLFTNTVYTNAVAGMYNKEGRFGESKQVISQVQTPDTVSWNIFLTACARNGDYTEAFDLFRSMQRAGFLMDNFTAVSLLSMCSKMNCLKLGSLLHGLVIKTNSGCFEIFVNNVLLDMYAKCGNLKCSLRVFEEMDEKNLISWTALISGLGLHGHFHEALERFKQMEIDGFKPDGVAFLAVLSGCRHSGLVEEGMRLFERMRSLYKIEPEMEHYTCVVDLLCRYGHLKEAEVLISNMPFRPNAVIWRTFLQGCKRYGSIMNF